MRLLSGGKGGGRGAEEGPFRRHNHSPPHPIPLSHSISLSAPPGTGPKRSAGTRVWGTPAAALPAVSDRPPGLRQLSLLSVAEISGGQEEN